MPHRQPKDFNPLAAFFDLPAEERKVLCAYIYCRTLVKGAGPDEMTPAELMALLTGDTGAKAA